MSDHDPIERMRREEEALLGRCKSFVLGHPGAPGRGSKNILYFTPCGRWLQVAAGDVLHRRAEVADIEYAQEIHPKNAASWFDEYNWPTPPELDQPSPWWKEESLGGSVVIERHALGEVLRSWARDWPPSTGHPAIGGAVNENPITTSEKQLNDCSIAILKTLEGLKTRSTREVLIRSMKAAGMHHGESTIAGDLSRLTKAGFLDNIQRSKPKGYALTNKGLALASSLSNPCLSVQRQKT